MGQRLFPKGTLVYRCENGHYPIYVVMSGHAGKFTLALPWEPTEPVVQGVAESDLERVFEKQQRRVSAP